MARQRWLSEKQRDHDSYVKGREISSQQLEYSLQKENLNAEREKKMYQTDLSIQRQFMDRKDRERREGHKYNSKVLSHLQTLDQLMTTKRKLRDSLIAEKASSARAQNLLHECQVKQFRETASPNGFSPYQFRLSQKLVDRQATSIAVRNRERQERLEPIERF